MSDSTVYRQKLEGICGSGWTICCIVAVALALRLAMAWHSGDSALTADSALYAQIGRNLAHGDGFTRDGHITAYGNFLYPAFLSVLYSTFGDSNISVYIAQALMDCLALLIVFGMTRRLTASGLASCLAAVFYAVYPPFIQSAGRVMTETLSILLMVLVVYALVFPSPHRRWLQCIIASVFFGLLILIRPAVILLPIPVAVVIWFADRGRHRNAWMNALVLVVVPYLVVAPWTIRNYVCMHEFIPVSTHGGLTLWAGTIQTDQGPLEGLTRPIIGASDPAVGSDFVRVSDKDKQRIDELEREALGKSEVDLDALFRREAVVNVRRDPVGYLTLAIPKVTRLWFHLWPGCKPGMANLLMGFMNAFLIVCAVIGSRRLTSGWLFSRLTLLIALYTTLVCVATLGIVRYSYPLFPFIIMLAASSVCTKPKGVYSQER